MHSNQEKKEENTGEQRSSRAPARGSLKIRGTNHNWGERTLLMAIVNVTPDSFSGDGLTDTQEAVERALLLRRQGATILDIGGQSTRPGHQPVAAGQELSRVLPVIRRLRQLDSGIISIDTTKAEVLSEAISAGADILNSVCGLSDELAALVEQHKIPVVVMHNKEAPVYESDVVDEVLAYLDRHASLAIAAGVRAEHVIVDPGIGFGKTFEHNLAILRSLHRITALGFPTLLGTSRKSFIGHLTGRPVEEREYGTAATVALAIAASVDIVRVHDVEATADVIKVSDAICRARKEL